VHVALRLRYMLPCACATALRLRLRYMLPCACATALRLRYCPAPAPALHVALRLRYQREDNFNRALRTSSGCQGKAGCLVADQCPLSGLAWIAYG
jgi:hypothetical protein